MDEKQSFINQQTTGDALRELQHHQGWQEIINILSAMYLEGVQSLIEKDSLEVRATLKAIENLATQIKLNIDFGKVAAEELKTEKFKMQDTSA